jgi:hypothetical protein
MIVWDSTHPLRYSQPIINLNVLLRAVYPDDLLLTGMKTNIALLMFLSNSVGSHNRQNELYLATTGSSSSSSFFFFSIGHLHFSS